MIMVTRPRIVLAASLLSVSALVGGVAAVAVAAPANRYDTGQLANKYEGSQPAGQRAQLTNKYEGSQPAGQRAQLTNKYEGSQPAGQGIQLTAVTQGVPASFYDH